MELYWHPMSGNSRKAVFALEETGADYGLRTVDILHGAQFDAAYRRLNPNALVPTLVDGEFVLWESSAIVHYLAERYPERGLLPHGTAARANVLRWLVWQPVTIMPCIRRLRELTVLRAPDSPPDEAALAAAKEALRDRLALIGAALGTREFLCGEYGAADIVMLPHLWYAAHDMQIALPPVLTDYVARLGARPAWQSVLAHVRTAMPAQALKQ
jgi:glutathione S-transferase